MTLYYKVRHILLQTATTPLLQNAAKKLLQNATVLLQMSPLLQNAKFITKSVGAR